ncbi:hypothetical protein AGMMS49992_33600 [Clostridia bacterium]|nr:hypothetical protein AGMMS49992_33600 [Clostridia bacterium]
METTTSNRFAAKVCAVLFIAISFLYLVNGILYPLRLSAVNIYYNSDFNPYSIISTLNNQYKEPLVNRFPLLLNNYFNININGTFAKLMGQHEMNKRVKLTNGNLAEMIPPITDNKLSALRRSVTSLANAQKERGHAYLLVITPKKTSPYENYVPIGEEDYYNDNMDIIKSQLIDEGVDVLDLREAAHEQGLNWSTLHYATDHHWTTQTGFWAYTEIVKTLSGMGVLDRVDPGLLDIGNYKQELYPKSFLGTDGK